MKSILYVGNKLSQHGFTPGVIETLGPLLEEEGYSVYYAGTYKSQVVRLVEIILKLIFNGRKRDYILIDTYSTIAFWYAFLAALVARVLNVPYIPLLHGGDLPRRLANSKQACQRLFNHSYANVAVSGYLKHEFEVRGYKVILIPNSINLDKYPFKIRNINSPLLLWVRSFHVQYNPRLAADVLKELLKIYPDAKLCMVGPDKDGSLEDFRNYINYLDIADHVNITGLLRKEQWINLSEEFNFFLNTTNVDNTPVSVVEAMALGLCVISTNPHGIPYLLRDGHDSLLVNPGDHKKMVEHIISIIKNPARAIRITESARKKVETFDWRVVRENWFSLLGSVVL